MFTKARLAIVLSKLDVFNNPKPHLEQYPTDSEIAASVLWNANMLGDVKDKIIADLGCGTGVLGLGALLLGAKQVFFVDSDSDAISICKENYEKIEFKLTNPHYYNEPILKFNKKVDVVIQNPPFGVQNKHADKPFLKKAFEIADIVYSLHKIESEGFIDKLSKDNGFRVTHVFKYSMPIKQTMDFHTHRIKRIRVGCWRLAKQKTF
ncbi:MAG: Ribosomal protein L11 methyltransferase [Candidatus Woesearchaeota archaeon]|nr:Ribosomal protein L11 methyltransferase [Candidatus Woesearchaeota archaeon]